ncbi:MAG: hypothetical protein ABI221_03000 [Candidatus Saccharimonadales bacterium]
MTNPEQVSGVEPLVMDAMNWNLHKAVSMARQRLVDNAWTVELVNIDAGQICLELLTDCNDPNRAMLQKLYELSHVDQAASSSVVTDDAGGYIRRTVLSTDHGFYFEEYYARITQYDGSLWERFEVTCLGDGIPLRPEHSKAAQILFAT